MAETDTNGDGHIDFDGGYSLLIKLFQRNLKCCDWSRGLINYSSYCFIFIIEIIICQITCFVNCKDQATSPGVCEKVNTLRLLFTKIDCHFNIYLHYVQIGFVNVLSDFQQFSTDLFLNWICTTCTNNCNLVIIFVYKQKNNSEKAELIH